MLTVYAQTVAARAIRAVSSSQIWMACSIISIAGRTAVSSMSMPFERASCLQEIPYLAKLDRANTTTTLA